MKGRKPTYLQHEADPLLDAQPPDWFTEAAEAEWRRVIPILNKRRILTDADLGSLENYCIAIGTVREMETALQEDGHIIKVGGVPKRNPAVGIQQEAMKTARMLAAELGLTPVSRARPKMVGDDDDQDDLLT